MVLFDAIQRFLRRLLGGSSSEPEPDPDPESEPDTPEPVPPLTYSDNDGATHLDIAIYQTTGLTDRLDRAPENNVTRFLAQALRDGGYNYTIRFQFDPLNLPDHADSLDAFAANERAGNHLNLLLGDRDGGGLAFVGGRYCIAPAGNIERPVPLTEEAPTDTDTPRLWINLRASALHEPGHTLGGNHSDVMTDPRWDEYPDAPASMLFNNVEDDWMDAPPP